MTTRYPSEFAVNMNLGKMLILQQPDLQFVAEQNYFDQNNPCHIYFICRRPRLSIITEKFVVSPEHLKMTFGINNKGVIEERQFTFKNTLGTDRIQIESDYPFNKFKLTSTQGEVLDAKVAPFLQKYAGGNFLDLEVLYIGQSYGVDGARTAPDRLLSHSTLQNIYAEATINNPDSEIYLALASFGQINIMMMDGLRKFPEEYIKDDDRRRNKISDKIHSDGISEQQKINFTEAALIKYFQPKYNKTYKDTFPNAAHLTYADCYKLDINAVCIEMNTYEMLNCRFFSESVKPLHSHLHKFPLHSEQDRRSMFDYSDII